MAGLKRTWTGTTAAAADVCCRDIGIGDNLGSAGNSGAGLFHQCAKIGVGAYCRYTKILLEQQHERQQKNGFWKFCNQDWLGSFKQLSGLGSACSWTACGGCKPLC